MNIHPTSGVAFLPRHLNAILFGKRRLVAHQLHLSHKYVSFKQQWCLNSLSGQVALRSYDYSQASKACQQQSFLPVLGSACWLRLLGTLQEPTGLCWDWLSLDPNCRQGCSLFHLSPQPGSAQWAFPWQMQYKHSGEGWALLKGTAYFFLMYLWRGGGRVLQMAKIRTNEVTLKSQINKGKLNDFWKGRTIQFRGFIQTHTSKSAG